MWNIFSLKIRIKMTSCKNISYGVDRLSMYRGASRKCWKLSDKIVGIMRIARSIQKVSILKFFREIGDISGIECLGRNVKTWENMLRKFIILLEKFQESRFSSEIILELST